MPDLNPLISLPDVSVALRYQLQSGGIQTTIAISVPERHQKLLELTIQTWRREGLQSDADLVIASGAEDRDQWMEDIPEVIATPYTRFEARGVSLICPYLIFPGIESLFQSAVNQGINLTYQVHCRRIPLSPKSLGKLKKDVIRLKAEDKIPSKLLSHQDQILKRLPDHTWHIDESLAVASSIDLERISDLLVKDFKDTYAQIGFPHLTIESSDDEVSFWREVLYSGLHSSLISDPETSLNEGARLRERELQALIRPHLPQVQASHRPAMIQEPTTSFDVFISYSSKDRLLANALCHALEGADYRCWIAPREISAGEMWPEAISRGIRSSRLMIVLFSESANLSRHVLREIERAVHHGLTIIPLRLEDTVMSDGMSYLLATAHWFDVLSLPLEERFADLLRELHTILPPSTPPSASQR